MSNPFLAARDAAEAATRDPHELSRLWWERLPMTYVDWAANSRVATTRDDFRRIETEFLKQPVLHHHFADLSRFRGKKVLEIGCGSGVASCLFAAGGADVTAIDLTQAAVTMARANAQLAGVSVNFVQMNAENIDFPSESFDYVFSWGVIHCSPDTRRIVDHVTRILRPGGSGLIMVYHRNSLRYYLRGLYWLLARRKLLEGYNLRTVQSLFTDGYYHRHFSTGEFTSMLNASGLRVTNTSISHMTDRYSEELPISVDRWLQSHFGWLLTAEFVKPASGVRPAGAA